MMTQFIQLSALPVTGWSDLTHSLSHERRSSHHHHHLGNKIAVEVPDKSATESLL